jgi:type IV secretion system protein VirB9
MKMMSLLNKLIILTAVTAIGMPAFAEQIPRGLSTDPRVKTVIYNPDDVTFLKVHYGYSTDIMFDHSETVQEVATGDSLVWETRPVGNHLFIKPMAASNTNMTVLTNLRHYNFQLTSANSQSPRDQIYELKFLYPDENDGTASYSKATNPAQCNPTQCNWKYSFTGDKAIAPIQAFDDGRFTYFKFRSTGIRTMPAIFSVDKNRNESLVNYHMQDGYIVVNRVGKQFTLRNGDEVTCVYNDAAIGDWSSI